jgi:signal transduction histidine kinase
MSKCTEVIGSERDYVMAASNVGSIRTGRIAIKKHGVASKTNSQHSHAVSSPPFEDFDRNRLLPAGMELILRQAPVAIVVCDAMRAVTLVNVAARKLVLRDSGGEPIAHVPGIWGEMLDSNGCQIPETDSPCMKALRGETTNGQECRLVRTGLSSNYILFSAVPITSHHEVIGMIATLVDLEQHKDLEFQLRTEAVSKERNRMAADLHDTLCQNLNAIVLLLRAAENEFSDDSEKARRHLRRAHEVARQSLADARRTLWTLFHEPLEKQDLAPGLSFIARQLFSGTPIKLDLSLQPETSTLSWELRRALLRIGREALANVLKHSNATKVHLDLVYQKREVQLCVFDDGRGFVGDSRPGTNHGSGLNNMRKRAEQMGGKLVVDSLPGQGTRLTAALPFSGGSASRPNRAEDHATQAAEQLRAA